MKDYIAFEVIDNFIDTFPDVYSLEDLHKILKNHGCKLSKPEMTEYLCQSENVFHLINKEFVNRTGVFTNRWFSFKPTQEEVTKGYFLMGHRCVPFVRPYGMPDFYKLKANSKYIKSSAVNFSMNTALDTYSLFGEGYVYQCIFGDKANCNNEAPMDQFSLPTEVTLTAWPLKSIEKKEKFTYGDRILCRVIDWEKSIIEIKHIPKSQNEFVVSAEDIQRQEWYKTVENSFLNNFNVQGPTSSIEQQLAYLFLENQEELCIESCGSIEEFFEHTNKVAICPYGIETRIWFKNDVVPYCGPWNSDVEDLVMEKVLSSFAPNFSIIIDVFLDNSIYCERTKKEVQSVEDFFKELFPAFLVNKDSKERDEVMLNIEKRRDILKDEYNEFLDYPIADIRKSVIEIFELSFSLLMKIATSGIQCEDFPQQELIILEQVYTNSLSLMDHITNPFMRAQIIENDPTMTIQGMFETFDEVSVILNNFLSANLSKGFGIVKNV